MEYIEYLLPEERQNLAIHADKMLALVFILSVSGTFREIQYMDTLSIHVILF